MTKLILTFFLSFADFDDLSCKMMFGQDPPEIKDDPVMKQPCFQFCKNQNLPANNGNFRIFIKMEILCFRRQIKQKLWCEALNIVQDILLLAVIVISKHI